jgi:hypothetical protein
MDMVLHAAKPLSPLERDGFLQALAEALRGQHEIGDGALYRAIRIVQQKHFKPPKLVAEIDRAFE